MKCINCSSSLDEKTTDFSLKIMLCKRCAVQVSKLRARLRSELEVLLASLDETLRFAVMAQGLPGGIDGELSRRGLLQFIVDMDDRCRTPSSKSTKQSVSTADGSGSSSRPSALDSR